jgi:hypothetical protein
MAFLPKLLLFCEKKLHRNIGKSVKITEISDNNVDLCLTTFFGIKLETHIGQQFPNDALVDLGF